MFRLSVICPDVKRVEDLKLILGTAGEVAVAHAFKDVPQQIELDRHLRLHRPHAMLMSTNNDQQTLLLAEHLHRAYPNLPLGVFAADRDASAVIPFMRANVKEVVLLPLERLEVLETVSRLCALSAGRDTGPKTGNLMCFLPSKPGVGASTIAINTANALAREGSKVLLVDGDLSSGMLRFMLKIESPVSIRDAASRISDMDEVLWPQMVTKVREGLDVLHSGPASLSNTISSETFLRLIDFWCRAYDVVCVDLSGNLEQHSLDVLRVANRIFVVSTSELAALHLLKEKVQLLKENEMGDRVRVIHNRATRHEELSKRQIEELAGLPVSKVFPNSYAETAAATKEGRTIRANSTLGSEFSAFASEMLGRQAPSRTPKTFTERLRALAGKRTSEGSTKAVTVHPPTASLAGPGAFPRG